jgi:DNA-binding transcriptional ArsR family regulator
MSISFMTLAWKTEMPSGRKLVLLALCDNANQQGECYPSIEVIAHKCSMGQRTVQQHISDLEAAGMLARHFRRGRSTVYRLDVRKFHPSAEYTAEQSPYPAGAAFASLPPQYLAAPPADLAPITVNEPSKEPPHNCQVTRATRLSSTWELPKAWAEWALAHQPTWTVAHVRLVADKFRDHWTALPGQRGSKSDWLATWRNWCHNEQLLVNEPIAAVGGWWTSDAAAIAKGTQLGVTPLPGESIGAFKHRVQQALNDVDKMVTAQLPPATKATPKVLTKATATSENRTAALDAARALKTRVFRQIHEMPKLYTKRQPPDAQTGL